MAIDFPSAGLTPGQIHTSGSRSWAWDGAKWGPSAAGTSIGDISSVAAGAGLTGGGSTGDVTLSLATPVSISSGGTGATTSGAALTSLGAAPLASPVFTGDPQAPTPATADNDTSIATTGFVKAQGYVTGGPYLPLAGGTVAGLTSVSHSDKTLQAFIGGTTKGVRFVTNINGTLIEGVDNTGAASYQPLYVGGSTLTFQLSGTTVGGFGTNNFYATSVSFNQVLGQNVIWNGSTFSTINAGYSGYINMDYPAGAWYLYLSTGSVGAGAAPAFANRMAIVNSTGACQNTSGTWSAISDLSLKENIADYTSGLAEVIQLRPVTFDWKGGELGSNTNYGLVAQEVQVVLPELVGEYNLGAGRIAEGESRTVLTVDPGRAIYAVINAIRELHAEVEALKAALPPATG